MQPSDIVEFWMTAGPAKWFAKSDAFDADIRARFEGEHHAAARGEHADWETTAKGCLALLILLDQFPRNLYRGSAHAFATDPLARRIARHAVDSGFDQEIDISLRAFVYLPFEHSEDPADQRLALGLYEALASGPDDETLKFAVLHHDIIEKFGRFPHRNACLGRLTTPAEQAFLDGGGFSG